MAHPQTTPPFEFSKISENVFIGTNACCRLHFDETLTAQGVTADISLEGEAIDHPQGVRTFVWLPTPDHAPPSYENVLVGIAALKKMLKNGQKVYITCKNGHGRAPTLYAAYLILEGSLSPEAAVQAIKKRRSVIHLEDGQTAFLQRLSAHKA